VASDEPERIEFDGLAGVSYRAIDIPRSIAPWRDLVALVRLLFFFRQRQIQIVHSTTPKAGLLTAVAAWLAGVPIRLHTFTGQPWVTMHGLKRSLARGSDKLIGVLNTRCYTDSPSQRLFLIAEGIVSAQKLDVIGAGSLAGVDTKRFCRDHFTQLECDTLKDVLGIPHHAPVLLFVGRITADKGVRELLLAFQQLNATSRDAHLVFVGHFDTESGMSNSVTRQDVENIKNVHVVDYTNKPEAYFAIADILCLPSYREGFGTVVIEAAAMGVPTVGTEIYGLSDAVVQGETGILVPPRNVEELAAALQKLLSDTPLRANMGAAAQRRAREQFDAQRFNQLVAAEYASLLERAGVVE
jgi:glycosyltransferase involved in cell wall biosynthesis